MMKQMPDEHTQFVIFTAEGLAGTENMGKEERKAYRQKLAEEQCAKKDS